VASDYQLLELQGDTIEPWLGAIGDLRIQVFREYPYLYDGSSDYESHYLRRYMEARDGLVVLVTEPDGRAVGATTCLPMAEEGPEFREPFERAGIDVTEIFYFGESVLLPEWRGRGIGKRFFDLREAHARALGYPLTAFCAVDRPRDHPRRPADYRPLDDFWRSRGYARHPDLQARFPWKEIGADEEITNSLTFWLRDWRA